MSLRAARPGKTEVIFNPKDSHSPEHSRGWYRIRAMSAAQKARVSDLLMGDGGTCNRLGTAMMTACLYGIDDWGNMFDPETNEPVPCVVRAKGSPEQQLSDESLSDCSSDWPWLFGKIMEFNSLSEVDEGNSGRSPKSPPGEHASTIKPVNASAESRAPNATDSRPSPEAISADGAMAVLIAR